MIKTTPVRNRPGFSLVELLVVIVIIAILVTVLLPAVNSALQSGKRKGVENNMAQLVRGAMLYGNNNDNYLPLPMVGAVKKPAWADLPLPAYANHWANVAPAAMSHANAAEYAAGTNKALFYAGTSLFHVKGATYPGSRLTTPEWGFGMNELLRDATFPTDPRIRISTIGGASSVPMFAEGGMSGESQPGRGYTTQIFNGEAAVGKANFLTRYGKVGSICFSDTHVEAVDITRVMSATSDIRWTP